ncbi:hypothetical protein ANTPLA_LOCUS8964 [Anthophora plagiata]
MFIWIPSYVGIKGNEVADLAAKTASRQDTLNEVERIPFNYYRREINKRIKENWNERLTRLVASKLPSWKPGSYKPDIDKLCRRDQVIITRMLIGHSRLTHTHLFLKEEASKCTLCTDNLSIKHIIFDCHHFNGIRSKSKIQDNINEIISSCDSMNNIIAYLKETEIYSKM